MGGQRAAMILGAVARPRSEICVPRRKSFRSLAEFGEAHMHDKVGYDFFAVSMPELEVYQDDIQKRSDDYCRRLMALGRKGLSKIL